MSAHGRFARATLARAFAFTLGATSSVASAAPIAQIDYTSYTVRIAPRESLLAALNAATPFIEHGEHYHAYTRWSVSWNYHWFESASGVCRITDATVTVSSTITLPRLETGDTAQRSAFARYLGALKTHELGHHAIGMQAGAAVERALLTLPPASHCTALETQANAIANRTLAGFSSADADYDRATDHGRSQGASLAD